MSALGGKADMTFAGSPLSRSLLGVKRTWLVAPHMSANDPKRTSRSVARPFPDPRLNRYYASGCFGHEHEATKIHCSYWRRGGDAARGSSTAERADSAHRRADVICKGRPGVGPCRGVPPGIAPIRLDRWSKSTNRVSL